MSKKELGLLKDALRDIKSDLKKLSRLKINSVKSLSSLRKKISDLTRQENRLNLKRGNVERKIDKIQEKLEKVKSIQNQMQRIKLIK